MAKSTNSERSVTSFFMRSFGIRVLPAAASTRTDNDKNNRLYLEDSTLDIYKRKGLGGVVVSVNGQIPNNMAFS